MNTRAIITLFRKETFRFKEVVGQTIFAPVLTNILFLVIFGVALSERTSGFAGFEYLQVLVPGLVAMGIMMNAFQNPIGSLMIAKYTNVINELLMIPMRGFEIMIAYVGAGLLRGLLVGLVTLIAGMFFVDVPFHSIPLILVFSILLGGTFASIGAITGIVAPDFDKTASLTNFVLTPLIYLGGVFYSISTLPSFVQTLSRANPIFYFIDGFRYAFLGVGDTSIAISLGVTILVFAGFFAVASWMFQTGYKLKT